MEEKSRLVIVDMMKAAACIMIFLYHCNTILPGEWKFLTVLGPEMGNNLFFMISGFALMPSVRDTEKGGGFRWYARRLLRIVPVTAAAYLLMYIAGYYTFSDRAQVFAVFVYPTLYWFISAILAGYLIIYILGRHTPFPVRLLMEGLLFGACVLAAGTQERYYIIGLVSMMGGYMIREIICDGMISIPFSVLYILIAAGGAAFAIGKYRGIYGLTAGGVLILGLSLLYLGYGLNDRMQGIYRYKAVPSVMRYVGDMALPLYIVQCFMGGAPGFRIEQTVNFPISFALNLILCWGLGSILLIFMKLTRFIKI